MKFTNIIKVYALLVLKKIKKEVKKDREKLFVEHGAALMLTICLLYTSDAADE